jgi:hypothetical protein
MKDNKLVSEEDVLPLYDERDVSLYNPPEILEVIFVQKGFLERLKIKSVKAVKNIPKTFANLVTSLFFWILKGFGFSTGKSILMKFLPFKVIIQWALNFLMVLFPTFSPLIAFGKMMM